MRYRTHPAAADPSDEWLPATAARKGQLHLVRRIVERELDLEDALGILDERLGTVVRQSVIAVHAAFDPAGRVEDDKAAARHGESDLAIDEERGGDRLLTGE